MPSAAAQDVLQAMLEQRAAQKRRTLGATAAPMVLPFAQQRARLKVYLNAGERDRVMGDQAPLPFSNRIAGAFEAAEGMQEPSQALYAAKHRRAQGLPPPTSFLQDVASLGPRALGGVQKMWQAVPMAAEALYNDPLGSINSAGLAGQAATDAIVQGVVRPFTQFGDPNVDPVENAADIALAAMGGSSVVPAEANSLRAGIKGVRQLKQETPFSGIKRDIPIEKTTATYAKGQKLLPEKPFDITQVPEGSHFVSTFGDRSDIGKRLTGIGGEKFQEPVDLYGGAGFMRRANNPDEAGWASGKSVITKLQNAVRPLQETGKPVYLIHTGMGQRAVDFSSMMIKTLEQQIKNKPLSKAAIKAFDKRMKAQWGKDHPALPDWPGWDNVNIDNLSGPERLKAVKLMDTDDMRKLGFPDVGAARWAITDPKQRNSPFAGTGASIFELGGPIEHNVNPRVGHPDYPSQATSPGGKYVGTLPEIIHGLEFFVDVKKGLKPGITNESHIGRKFLMSPAIQRVSPEWVQHIVNYLKSDRGQKLGIAGAIGAGLLTAEQAQEMFGAEGGEGPAKT